MNNGALGFGASSPVGLALCIVPAGDGAHGSACGCPSSTPTLGSHKSPAIKTQMTEKFSSGDLEMPVSSSSACSAGNPFPPWWLHPRETTTCVATRERGDAAPSTSQLSGAQGVQWHCPGISKYLCLFAYFTPKLNIWEG